MSSYHIDNSNSNNNDNIQQHINNSSSSGGSGGGINNLSFEKLLREPNQINELKSNTIKEMQKLALDHYQLFIENYKTLNYTVSKIQNVSHQIENGLLSNLPTISSSCESFSSKSQSLTDRRASIKNLLDNFPTLLDILEIPQLMDTCIKNNSFDEALQLELFSKKIYKQYSNNTVVIEIIKEIKICTRSLITTLQQQLRQDISLTNCIKTIGYLRRLSIYKENELKIIFLHSRDQWLINSLKFDVADSNHVTYLTKLTDSCRTNIFDIVTQYNAIFSNESNDEEQLDDLILYNWVQQKIKIYISIIDTTLNNIKSGSSISYVLENSMYFSMSISRVGIDFRNLLEPIFEKHILNNFISQITTANHHFLETLKTYKFPIQKHTTTSTTTTSSSSSQYISPPLSILQHQPLAVLVNLILKSFNELKDCFPLSLKSIAANKLKELIISIVGGVTSFYNQQLSNTIANLVNDSNGNITTATISSSFDKVFHSFCKCLAEDFIPFIVRCFDIICNQQQQQQQTNETDNGQIGNSIGIDIDSLVLSLKKIYLTDQQITNLTTTADSNTTPTTQSIQIINNNDNNQSQYINTNTPSSTNIITPTTTTSTTEIDNTNPTTVHNINNNSNNTEIKSPTQLVDNKQEEIQQEKQQKEEQREEEQQEEQQLEEKRLHQREQQQEQKLEEKQLEEHLEEQQHEEQQEEKQQEENKQLNTKVEEHVNNEEVQENETIAHNDDNNGEESSATF